MSKIDLTVYGHFSRDVLNEGNISAKTKYKEILEEVTKYLADATDAIEGIGRTIENDDKNRKLADAVDDIATEINDIKIKIIRKIAKQIAKEVG